MHTVGSNTEHDSILVNRASFVLSELPAAHLVFYEISPFSPCQ